MIGADGIQVIPSQEPVFGSLRVVELEPLNPLSGRRNGYPFPKSRLDILDSWQSAIGSHNMARPAAQYVDVRVDEARQDGLAGKLEDFSIRSHEHLNVGVAANTDEPRGDAPLRRC